MEIIGSVHQTEKAIDIYDSIKFYSKNSSSLARQLSCILNTDEESFLVRHIDVQCQSVGNNYGLFKVAFATSLCIIY